MLLLGICVAALLIGLLRLATQRPPLPTGSSYSTDPAGARALFDWSATLGLNPRRVQDVAAAANQTSTTLIVLQPESAVESDARTAFDAVPRQKGTLVVAGDSPQWLLYVRSLGVTVEPIRPSAVEVSTPDSSLKFTTVARYRLHDSAGQPLLVDANGDWFAVRKPVSDGWLIVLATPEPLLNGGLRDQAAASFAFREILASAEPSQSVAFDEIHHLFNPPAVTDATVTVEDLLFQTPVGRAIVYAAALVFVYLLLSGRRFGPPLTARAPSETRRTMFEHVQMLANLYRRAGQFNAARTAFARHYARRLAHSGAGSPQRLADLTRALARIEAARSEADLIEAVGAATDAR
jgi:hypothetical protein